MKIEYDRVSFAYRSESVLKEVSCTIESGRTALIIGHNGSGKSTFLKLMNGILKPAGGRVSLGETNTGDRRTSELAHLCALSFQNPDDQLFAQTVAKELHFGIRNTGGNGSMLKPVVTALRLDEYLDSNPYSLTYASRRLVAIASSIVMDTPIVALDEPTAGLSKRETEYLAALIGLLRAKGKTIVIVTHDLDFLLPYADDLLMLSHGEVKYSGGRNDLFARKDARELMRQCGVGYPVFPRISAAAGIDVPAFDASEVIDAVIKKEPAPPGAQTGSTSSRGHNQENGCR